MTLHVERRGSGEPLVLLHGLGGTSSIWAPVVPRLAEHRDVVVLDMPGFGRSDPLPSDERPTAANLARAISGFCAERLGIERPHVAGNSLGGWVALELGKAGEAASVCGISPAGLWRRPLGPRRTDTRRVARRLRPLVSAALASRRARAALLASTMAHPERLSAREARTIVSEWIASPGYDAANAEMRGAVFEHPERVVVPTTIAWGDEDRLLAQPRPERLPPRARYLVLAGCGHTPTWDDPDLIAELLLAASTSAPTPAIAV
jgi:pimeloyl-ACP methyl ester carboxylesterase